MINVYTHVVYSVTIYNICFRTKKNKRNMFVISKLIIFFFYYLTVCVQWPPEGKIKLYFFLFFFKISFPVFLFHIIIKKIFLSLLYRYIKFIILTLYFYCYTFNFIYFFITKCIIYTLTSSLYLYEMRCFFKKIHIYFTH